MIMIVQLLMIRNQLTNFHLCFQPCIPLTFQIRDETFNHY